MRSLHETSLLRRSSALRRSRLLLAAPEKAEKTANPTPTDDQCDAAGFEQAAQNAKATCPVSKALTGTQITVAATLA